jgi:hypothetical protein
MERRAPEDVVNSFLLTNYRTGLEDVLAEATVGRVPIAVADPVQLIANSCLDIWRDDEGAVGELYEGVLRVAGIDYHYRCAVFTDREGGRFVADISEFRPQGWQTRMVVGGGRAMPG